MDNEKNPSFGENEESEISNELAPRARNRTVMLTPDITGEVRARLAQEMGHPPATSSAGAGRASAGFESPVTSSYAPAAAKGFGTPTSAPMQHAAPQQNVRRGEGAFFAQESALVGFLVSYDSNPNGTVFELRSGRLIVTSESPGGGNYLMILDTSVSPMHAIIRITPSGEIQVLDQLSEFGTRVQRFGSEQEEELSGEKTSLEHGDVIKFGNRKFHVCVITRGDS